MYMYSCMLLFFYLSVCYVLYIDVHSGEITVAFLQEYKWGGFFISVECLIPPLSINLSKTTFSLTDQAK